jgi:hypothetical protein
MTPEAFANQLGGAVLKSGSWYGLCPSHDDTRASLKIDIGTKGVLVFSCTSKRCSNADVLTALKAKGLWPPNDRTASVAAAKKKDRRESIIPVPDDAPPCTMIGDDPKLFFPYRDEDGHLLGYTRRFELADGGKEFKVFTYCRHLDTGKVIGWQGKGWAAPKPLFGLDVLGTWRRDHIGASPTVVLFEGERKARAAQEAFAREGQPWVALSISGGTGQHKTMDLKPLDGCDVIYWPDAGERMSRNRWRRSSGPITSRRSKFRTASRRDGISPTRSSGHRRPSSRATARSGRLRR